MKKQAFTLAEALIALGVVGVVAALILPMANKVRPDEMKVSYLKTYDSLSTAVNSLTNASKLYNPVLSSKDSELEKNYNISDYPLLDTYTKKVVNGVDCGDGTKAFGKVLRETFKGKDTGDGWFVTKDGKAFKVEANTDEEHVLTNTTTDKVNLYYTITVDLNGTRGVNSLYSNDNTKPDRFKFLVLPNGAVVASDVYGQMYLSKRNNWKKLSDDIIAKNLEKFEEITIDNIGDGEIVIADLDPTNNPIIADGDNGGSEGDSDNGSSDKPGYVDPPDQENPDDGSIDFTDLLKPKQPGDGNGTPATPPPNEENPDDTTIIFNPNIGNIPGTFNPNPGGDNNNNNGNSAGGGGGGGLGSGDTPSVNIGDIPEPGGFFNGGSSGDSGGGETSNCKKMDGTTYTPWFDNSTGEFSDTIFWGKDEQLYYIIDYEGEQYACLIEV